MTRHRVFSMIRGVFVYLLAATVVRVLVPSRTVGLVASIAAGWVAVFLYYEWAEIRRAKAKEPSVIVDWLDHRERTSPPRVLRDITIEEYANYKWTDVTNHEDEGPVLLRGKKLPPPKPSDNFVYRLGNDNVWRRVQTISPPEEK